MCDGSRSEIDAERMKDYKARARWSADDEQANSNQESVVRGPLSHLALINLSSTLSPDTLFTHRCVNFVDLCLSLIGAEPGAGLAHQEACAWEARLFWSIGVEAELPARGKQMACAEPACECWPTA